MVKQTLAALGVASAMACSQPAPNQGPPSAAATPAALSAVERKHLLERVGEAAVVQLYADGFSRLPLRDKTLIWHLAQAALAGRDIYYDQRYAHNLEMRDVLEAVLLAAKPSAGRPAAVVEPATLAEVERYTKLFWLNTGPYNNLTARKFVPECTPEAFASAVRAAVAAGARVPLRPGETLDRFLTRMTPLFFDVALDPMVTAKSPPAGKDILTASANNLYAGVALSDLTAFNEQYPLNSRLVKRDGRLFEESYRVGGRYGKAIEAIVGHLTAAIPFATDPMADALKGLIAFYRSGATSDRVAYDIAWVADTASPVDTINGFIEVYMDARGVKGSWEALVFYVNRDKTEAIQRLAREAQWFEDRMPWDPKYRKAAAVGITANAIDVVIETGDSGPVTPIGINLPNDQAVREKYGSKSVSLSNVIEAYDKSTPTSMSGEFSWSPEETARAGKWRGFSGELSTNMHEVIGHASGRLAERLKGDPQSVLKEQYSALEEGRADLVALYFIADPKLAELGIFKAEDQDAIVRAQYEEYARNALVQLRRVRQGTQLEEDHMRNRQMIVHWLMRNTKAVERRTRDSKTFYVVTDPALFRQGVGTLLADVQRIKSEADYPAAKALFETYGVHIDPALRDEIVARVDRLHLPSYTGFVMPKLEVVRGPAGEVTDVAMSYPQDLTRQMLEYAAATRSLRD